jgi:hypothetical protein
MVFLVDGDRVLAPYVGGPRPARSGLDSNASCPAATGELACQHFPDRAHRCAGARNGHAEHRCTCGSWWAVREVGPVD